MATIEDAIIAINSSAQFTSSPTDDADGITWLAGTSPISKSDLEAKKAELQTAYDAKEYQRDRAKVYPEIGDQLDMIYHDQVDSTTTFKDAIKAVKDANPKP